MVGPSAWIAAEEDDCEEPSADDAEEHPESRRADASAKTAKRPSARWINDAEQLQIERMNMGTTLSSRALDLDQARCSDFASEQCSAQMALRLLVQRGILTRIPRGLSMRRGARSKSQSSVMLAIQASSRIVSRLHRPRHREDDVNNS